MANAAKRGAPHMFTAYEPAAGRPAGPLPAAICLHGGGGVGSHWSWAPESVHYANTEATPVGGVTVPMDVTSRGDDQVPHVLVEPMIRRM
ncbi:MAG: hypothetical protein FJ306_09165 [Planctomycetes bacterium]|nr:hypothetical protein [Planctomycetota bacterium]